MQSICLLKGHFDINPFQQVLKSWKYNKTIILDIGIQSNRKHIMRWNQLLSFAAHLHYVCYSVGGYEGDAKWNAHFAFVITKAHGRYALMWANAIDYTALAQGNRQQTDVLYSKKENQSLKCSMCWRLSLVIYCWQNAQLLSLRSVSSSKDSDGKEVNKGCHFMTNQSEVHMVLWKDNMLFTMALYFPRQQ